MYTYHSRKLFIGLFAGFFAVAIIGLVLIVSGHGHHTLSSAQLIQDTEPEIPVMPATLDRFSWSAVLAGSLMTLVLMFVFNLIGFALGLTQVNPDYEHNSAEPGTVAQGAVIWIGVTSLVALFAGGWLASYFAGIPERTDGLLHGAMVWAVSGFITVALVLSGLGRLANGLSGLLSSGLNLAGSIAGGTAQAAGGVAQAAGNVVSGVGNLTLQTLSTLAQGIQNSVQMTASGLSNLTDTAIENTPDVKNALSFQDLTFDEIKMNATRLMRQAGVAPERVEQEIRQAGEEVKSSVEQAVRNPDEAAQILNLALQRVLRRGEDVASDVDRESLISVLTANSKMSREEASQQIQTWEEQFNQVKEQTRQARELARQKADEMRQQLEQRARQTYEEVQSYAANLQQEAEDRIQQARQEAESTAREVAQQAKDVFTKWAAGIAVAMVIGAIAAGIGGYIGAGAVKTLPEVTVGDVNTHGDF